MQVRCHEHVLVRGGHDQNKLVHKALPSSLAMSHKNLTSGHKIIPWTKVETFAYMCLCIEYVKEEKMETADSFVDSNLWLILITQLSICETLMREHKEFLDRKGMVGPMACPLQVYCNTPLCVVSISSNPFCLHKHV